MKLRNLRFFGLALLIVGLGFVGAIGPRLVSATQAQSNVEDFETGDFSSLPWNVSYWRVTSEHAHSGDYSAAAYSTSRGVLEVTLTSGPGQVSFWRYSDDSGWLKFYIDGELIGDWRDMPSSWSEESFPVSVGNHTFRWEASSSDDDDNDVYIDDITFPAAGGTAEQIITQDYAIDGDTATSTVTFGASITGGTIDLYLTGDFNDSGECYTLTIEGETVYHDCDIGFEDDPIATARGGAHSLGSFPLPDSAIGKTSITITGETSSEVNNSNDPAARAWIVIHASLATAAPQLEDFETGDFSKFPWQTGGDAPWFITGSDAHSGSYAAKPSTIADGEKSWLQVTLNLTTGGEISFWFKVSSEPDHDFLHFSIDDEERDKWSGDTDWQQATFPVPSGSHTFRWKYAKDGAGSSGADTAFLDDIAFASAAVPAPSPPVQPPSGMVLIPAGSFEMGDSFSEDDPAERPVHEVYVSAFYMDRFEVTKGLWDEVASWAQGHGYDIGPGDGSTNYSDGTGRDADHPVTFVSWYEAVKWLNARSEKEGLTPAYYTDSSHSTVYRTGRVNVQNDWVRWDTGYRLPTEAEWECAARGGLQGKRYPWGDEAPVCEAGAPNGARFAPCPDGTAPAGTYSPNGYGLYDMAANVWEWVWDWYNSNYYASSPESDPRGPSSGWDRALRGGSWYRSAAYCRVANRGHDGPGRTPSDLGFRAVLPPGQ